MSWLCLGTIFSWLFSANIDIGFFSIASFLFYAAFLIINFYVYDGILNPQNAVASAWKMVVIRLFSYVLIMFSVVCNIAIVYDVRSATPIEARAQKYRFVSLVIYLVAILIGTPMTLANVVVWREIKRRANIRLG